MQPIGRHWCRKHGRDLVAWEAVVRPAFSDPLRRQVESLLKLWIDLLKGLSVGDWGLEDKRVNWLIVMLGVVRIFHAIL